MHKRFSAFRELSFTVVTCFLHFCNISGFLLLHKVHRKHNDDEDAFFEIRYMQIRTEEKYLKQHTQ